MSIEVHLDEDTKIQSLEAGYADVNDYVRSLVERDRTRLACLKALQDVNSGNTRSFDQFDAEFRRKHQVELES